MVGVTWTGSESGASVYNGWERNSKPAKPASKEQINASNWGNVVSGAYNALPTRNKAEHAGKFGGWGTNEEYTTAQVRDKWAGFMRRVDACFDGESSGDDENLWMHRYLAEMTEAEVKVLPIAWKRNLLAWMEWAGVPAWSVCEDIDNLRVLIKKHMPSNGRADDKMASGAVSGADGWGQAPVVSTWDCVNGPRQDAELLFNDPFANLNINDEDPWGIKYPDPGTLAPEQVIEEPKKPATDAETELKNLRELLKYTQKDLKKTQKKLKQAEEEKLKSASESALYIKDEDPCSCKGYLTCLQCTTDPVIESMAPEHLAHAVKNNHALCDDLDMMYTIINVASDKQHPSVQKYTQKVFNRILDVFEYLPERPSDMRDLFNEEVQAIEDAQGKAEPEWFLSRTDCADRWVDDWYKEEDNSSFSW